MIVLSNVIKLTNAPTQKIGLENSHSISISVSGEPYEGDYEVTPTTSEQVLNTKDKLMVDDVTIKAMPFVDTGKIYDEGYEAGKQAEYDELWDNLQRNGTRAHYANAFAYTGWNDKIFNPKYPITPTSTEGIANMFTWNVDITDTKVSITAYGKCGNAFNQCLKLKRVPRLIFDRVTKIDNIFNNCINLEELYCEGTLDITGFNVQHSTKLNRKSITSIVNVLSTTTSGLTVTLPKEAVNKAFETSEGANDGTTSAEWLALIATRSNWTISLV